MGRNLFQHIYLLLALTISTVIVTCSGKSTPVKQTAQQNDEMEFGFVDYELLPEFPGGMSAFMKYRDDNLKYPEEALDSNIEGTVIVKYKIKKNGEVDSVSIFRSAHPLLDDEVLRFMSSLPKYSPGSLAGEPTDFWFTQPFRFNISDYMRRYNIKFPAFKFDNGGDPICEGLYRIVDEKGRLGFADEDGNTVIAPRFAFAYPFENGKAKVTDTGYMRDVNGSSGESYYWESDKWYYIDKRGKKVE